MLVWLGVNDGNILQMDFLFERRVKRPTQNYRYGPLHGHDDLLEWLKVQKERSPDFSVIDVGAIDILRERAFQQKPLGLDRTDAQHPVGRIHLWLHRIDDSRHGPVQALAEGGAPLRGENRGKALVKI